MNEMVAHEMPQEHLNYETRRDTRKRIMVIDDERDFRLDLAELLFYQSYDVTTVENGALALMRLQEGRELPDLIVLDLHMPMVNGQSFLEELKAHEELQHIPVVVVSGFLEDKIKLADAELTKPLDRLEFLRVIEEIMS